MKKFFAAIPLLIVSAVCAFTAACQTNEISISFNVNGGTAITDIVKKPGEEYILPVPERTGYEFEGWYLAEDFSGSPVESATASESVTYYAKWAQLYAVTLNLDGGTLSRTDFYLKAGANVYDLMVEYVPVKSGFTFGAWFDGETELKRNTRMTENGITLTAKYKVAYSVEIYKQNLEGTEYVKDDEATFSGADYVGVTISPENTFTGFKQVENQSAVTSLALTSNATANVLKLYYDREEYQVNFVSNYPDGSANVIESVTAKYGTAVELPMNFTFEGYCLKGYSTTQDGDSEYDVNFIATVLYKKEENVEKTTFYPDRNTALYAVWSKGYTDMFGGNDYIYLLDEDSDEVYLARGNVFFKGEYEHWTDDGVTYRGFTIRTSTETIEGVLNQDGTFCYIDASRIRTYHLYKNDNTIDNDYSVSLNEDNLLTYTYPFKLSPDDLLSVPASSTGRYYIVDGKIEVHFTSGSLAGTDAIMSLGYILNNGNREYIFRIRNEEEVAMGSILRIGIDMSGNVGLFREGYYSIKLDGFGVATLTTPTQEYNYSYELSEDKTQIDLKASYGISAGVLKLMTLEGNTGYMFYNSDLDLTVTQDDGSIKLDGICRATYLRNGQTINGYYLSMGEMSMGGTMVVVIADGETYNVLIRSETKQEIIDGETQKITEYHFAEKPASYAEYYYSNESSIYYIFLVIDDEQVGKASIYQRVAQNSYAKVATGSYEFDEQSQWYTFVKEEYFELENASSVVDMSTLESFIFRTGVEPYTSSGTTQYFDVHYWLMYTADSKTSDNTTVYTGADGEKLSLVAKFAIYNGKDINVSGVYSVDDDILSFTLSEDSDKTYYFRINEDDKTFVALVSAPYRAYEINPDGTYNRNVYLYFDGTESNATYQYKDGDETVTCEGTYIRTDDITKFGYFIFTFTSSDGQIKFNYISTATSSAAYFSKSNSDYFGDYESVDDGVLTLDGYNIMAEYQSTNGYSYSGTYTVAEGNLITLHITNTSLVLYFDLGENRTFRLRGTEYGTYIIMDNRNTEGLFLELNGDMKDGTGTAKVFTAKTENGESVKDYIDEQATYSRSEDGIYTVKFNHDGGAQSLDGKLMAYTTSTGGFNAFVIIHDEVAFTYVNERDYSVLILDNTGSAVKYNNRGVRETGSYTLISDNILSYVNSSGSNAYIYVYDAQKGTARTVTFEETAYYANNLETLYFNRYGVAAFNGETRVYYTLSDTREITIYRLPEEGETAEVNRFGFIEEKFGTLSDVKEYKGNTYYRNSGYDLSFSRVEETKNDYPVLVTSEKVDGKLIEYKYPLKELVFSPTGALEFSTSGTVIIEDENDKTNDVYSCTVVREMVDGEIKTYITVPLRLGYYRFDIDLTFNGAAGNKNVNTYEVVSMTRVIELPSYSYLYTMYMYSMLDSMLGTNYSASIKNTLGTICIKYDYDTEGKVIGAVYDPETNDLMYVKDEDGNDTKEYVDDGGYITAVFGESSGLFDANGELLAVDHGKYTMTKQGNYNLYTVEFTGEDGYDYCLRFVYDQVQQGVYGYRLYGMTRVQTFEYGEYTVKVERVINSDSYNLYRGSFLSIELMKGETVIEMSYGVVNADGSVDYIVRTFGEGDEEDIIKSSIYYTITFKEKASEAVSGEDEGKIVPAYESVTVREYAVATYYSEDGKSYADIADNRVKLLNVDGRTYVVSQTEYDEETAVYTVTIRTSASASVNYTVKIENGKAVITLVEDEEDNS